MSIPLAIIIEYVIASPTMTSAITHYNNEINVIIEKYVMLLQD